MPAPGDSAILDIVQLMLLLKNILRGSEAKRKQYFRSLFDADL